MCLWPLYSNTPGAKYFASGVVFLQMMRLVLAGLKKDDSTSSIENASKLNLKLDILHDLLFCESNPIPVKWCLYKMGLIKKGIRLPLTWMDEKFDRPLTEGLIKSGVIDE